MLKKLLFWVITGLVLVIIVAPLAWIYLTAWMTRDQTVQFRNDVYAQDEQLLEATAEEAAFFNQAANHPLTAHMAR